MPHIGALGETVVGAASMGWLAKLPLWRGALVLGYHRIQEEGERTPFDPGVVSATPATLDAQLRFVTRHFRVVSPEALVRDHGSRRRRVVVTFDDGYRDNYELALPVLRAHGVPATFFLTTGFLDKPRVPWWDELAWMVKRSPRRAVESGGWLPGRLPLHGDRSDALNELARVYKSLATERAEAFLDFCARATGSGRSPERDGAELWMTWQMAAEVRDAGMVIGGHSVTHPVLGLSDDGLQRREIEECRERLLEELGVPMRFFAYPVGIPGAFNDFTRRTLRAAGVELAFSLYGGHVRPGRLDPYDVPRASVAVGTGERRFRAAVTLPQLFARW